MLIFFTCFVTIAVGCGFQELDDANSLCRGVPEPVAGGSDKLAVHYKGFDGYRASILNTLATLLLAFYANMCLGRYSEAYLASQTLRQRVVDLVTLAAGTIRTQHPRRQAVLLEFWRIANLYHLCTYVLADKTREVYSFQSFLLPVASAFGEHDGAGKRGMLRANEMRTLMKYAHGMALGRNRGQMADQRGDVESLAAVLHDALGVRFYRLVRESLDRQLTTAAWPVWGTNIARLRDAAADVKHASLFRTPRVYRDFTKWFVLMALLYDTLVLAATIGQVFSLQYKWAWIVALLVALAYCMLVTMVLLVVEACRDMEYPYGSDTLDMPGLSYVTSAATQSLVLVSNANENPSQQAARELQQVDMEDLFGADHDAEGLHDAEAEHPPADDDE